MTAAIGRRHLSWDAGETEHGADPDEVGDADAEVCSQDEAVANADQRRP